MVSGITYIRNDKITVRHNQVKSASEWKARHASMARNLVTGCSGTPPTVLLAPYHSSAMASYLTPCLVAHGFKSYIDCRPDFACSTVTLCRLRLPPTVQEDWVLFLQKILARHSRSRPPGARRQTFMCRLPLSQALTNSLSQLHPGAGRPRCIRCCYFAR